MLSFHSYISGNTDRSSSRSSPINEPISLKDHTTTLDQGVTLSDDGTSSRLTGFTDSTSEHSVSPFPTTASGYFPGTEYSKQYTTSTSYMRPQAPLYGTQSYSAPFRFGVPGPVPQRLFANAALQAPVNPTYAAEDYLPSTPNQPQYTAAHGTFALPAANAAHLVPPSNESSSYSAATGSVSHLPGQMADTTLVPASSATTSCQAAQLVQFGVRNSGMDTPDTRTNTAPLYSGPQESVPPIETSTPQGQQNVSTDISVTSSVDTDANPNPMENAAILKEGEDSLSKLSQKQVDDLKWKIALQELRRRNLRLPASYLEKERLKNTSSESTKTFEQSRVHSWTEDQKLYAAQTQNENAIADDKISSKEDDYESDNAGNMSPVNSDDNKLLNQEDVAFEPEKQDDEYDEDTEEADSSTESDNETSKKDVTSKDKPYKMIRSAARTSGMSTRMRDTVSGKLKSGGAGGGGRPKEVQLMFDQAKRDFDRLAAVQGRTERKSPRLPPIAEFRKPYVTTNPLTGPISVKRKLDDSNTSSTSAEQKKLKAKGQVAEENVDENMDESVDHSESVHSGDADGKTPQSQSAQSLLHGNENTPSSLDQSQTSDGMFPSLN